MNDYKLSLLGYEYLVTAVSFDWPSMFSLRIISHCRYARPHSRVRDADLHAWPNVIRPLRMGVVEEVRGFLNIPYDGYICCTESFIVALYNRDYALLELPSLCSSLRLHFLRRLLSSASLILT